MEQAIYYLGLGLLALGTAFQIIGSIGLLRLPDFYSRLHAVTKPDTLGIFLAVLGLAFMSGWQLVSAKLLFGALFIVISSPAASHALGRCALKRGLKVMLAKDFDAEPRA